MGYTPNPKKAELWSKALSAGIEVFEKMEEQTKAGFTRPMFVKIMKPMWPFFEKLDQDETEEVYLSLEHFFEDFWDDYKRIFIVEAEREFPGEETEPPITAFSSTFGVALNDNHLYDRLILEDVARD